jgi:hypothetical protein
MKKKFFLSLFTNVFFSFLGKNAIHLKELYLTHQKKNLGASCSNPTFTNPLALSRCFPFHLNTMVYS